MKTSIIFILSLAALAVIAETTFAYPPAVGILTKAKSCMSCHVNNGPWVDDAKTIIDVLDKETMKSLRQPDGTFLLNVRRNQTRTLLTVIGRPKADDTPAPYRNAWLYVDPKTIESTSLSKFAPGWDVNLPGSCRIIGDNIKGFEDDTITALPMTVRPTDAAQDGEVILQVMLTKGESVKGRAKEGMIGNYFERKVILRVNE